MGIGMCIFFFPPDTIRRLFFKNRFEQHGVGAPVGPGRMVRSSRESAPLLGPAHMLLF